MKQGWEIKKVGEVFDLQMGKTPNRDNRSYWGGNNIWLSISDIKDKYVGLSKETITDLALKESNIKKVKSGTVIMSFKLTVGRTAITTTDLYTNEAIMAFIPKEDYNILPEYTYYYLSHYKWENSNKAVMGITLNKKVISDSYFEFPERAEQERIVGELDCLSGIIAAKRAQLRELDTLAQSIFYTMFGDPITNDKGWQTDVLENVAPQKGYKGVVPSIEEKYWVLNLDMVESNTGEILQKCYFDKESIGSSTNMFDMNNILYSKLRPYLNKVVIPYDIGYATSELVPLCPNKNLLNRIFFAHILRSRFFVNYISAKVAGAKMPRVSMDVFKKFHVILPSLCLQNEFAKKIENIERQKELITKSIKDTEDLFNSRMSYYFD